MASEPQDKSSPSDESGASRDGDGGSSKSKDAPIVRDADGNLVISIPESMRIVEMTPESKRGLLLIISGPSGVGKTTITHEVERRVKGVFSVSMTTRAKTHADVEGRDYFFVDYAEFKAIAEAGELLEWAEVYPGKCYGTPRGPVEAQLKAGRVVILEIDVQGAIQVKQAMPDALAVFVLPPSKEELLRRLQARAREDQTLIKERFDKAQKEIAEAKASDVYDHFIVNDDLAVAIQQAVDHVENRRRGDDGPTLFDVDGEDSDGGD